MENNHDDSNECSSIAPLSSIERKQEIRNSQKDEKNVGRKSHMLRLDWLYNNAVDAHVKNDVVNIGDRIDVDAGRFVRKARKTDKIYSDLSKLLQPNSMFSLSNRHVFHTGISVVINSVDRLRIVGKQLLQQVHSTLSRAAKNCKRHLVIFIQELWHDLNAQTDKDCEK
jgi:hypothetical protein